MASLLTLAVAALALPSVTLAGPVGENVFKGPFSLVEDRSDLSVQIVGGTTASSGEFPYIVSLTSDFFCGGVLINAYTVLSAGHCSDAAASSYTVRAGSLAPSSGGVTSKVSAIRTHPSYGGDPPNNDLALFHLSTPIAETATIKYAVLPAQGSDPTASTLMTVAGWGLTSETGSSISSALRKVSVPVISRSSCQTSYRQYDITTSMFCAAVQGGGKDSCSGDSGGPIVNDSTKVLDGIVSWGIGCARAAYPGVYTRIGNFRTWIDSNKWTS